MDKFDNKVFPPEPESIEDCGLAGTTVEQLILKILYFNGDLYGQDLSQALGLKFSVIQGILESLELHYHLQVRRSMGMGDVGALLALTETGRARARECLEQNQYAGPAPVPLEQYAREEGAGAAASLIPLPGNQSCSDHWNDRLAKVPTVSGTLSLLASLRDSRGWYCERESESNFGVTETGRTLAKLHARTFLDWLKMNLEQQSRDLVSYFAMDARAAGFARDRDGWIGRLIPAGASAQERELFAHDLCLLLDAVVPQEQPAEECPRLERIA